MDEHQGVVKVTKTLHATFSSPKDYEKLTTEEIVAALRAAKARIERWQVRTSDEERKVLLPALTVLRQRLPHGEYQSTLRKIGLTPATVRSWKYRGLHHDQIEKLMEEEPGKISEIDPAPKKPDPQLRNAADVDAMSFKQLDDFVDDGVAFLAANEATKQATLKVMRAAIWRVHDALSVRGKRTDLLDGPTNLTSVEQWLKNKENRESRAAIHQVIADAGLIAVTKGTRAVRRIAVGDLLFFEDMSAEFRYAGNGKFVRQTPVQKEPTVTVKRCA